MSDRHTDPGAARVSARVPEVVLYTRVGCHLCENAEAVLREAMASQHFELRLVDIDTDPELVRRYGVRVPVVAINGEELFEYEVPPDLLLGALRRATATA